MAECSIENHPDFNEPMEVRHTDMDQVGPTLTGINKMLGDNLNRIRSIEGEIESIRFAQFGTQGVNEDGMHIDAENGLRGIQLQSEKCALEAGNQRLQENRDNLLIEGQRLARTSSEQFEKYKEYILDGMQNFLSVSDVRLIYFGAQNIDFDENDSSHNTFVNDYLSSISFFGFDRNDAITMFENMETYESVIQKIQGITFEDISR